MYHQYFGLNEAPFSIAVNPRYLFMSARHRDALAHLLYGVGAGGGFILLTGEVGTGKTTINRCLLEQLPHDTDIAIILNPALNAMELLASACDELGINYDPGNHTLKTLTDSLHSFLLENYDKGRKTVLMIDEAQHLDFDVLEQIRLLTNLETHSEKLLQIILIGQPELAQLLARPELRQLNQRITARYNLEPLNPTETGAYIHHRLQVAGMTPDREIFPPAVVRGIYRRTRGIPRLINVLCDRILLGAYGRNKNKADMAMLRLAAKEVLGEEGRDRTSSGYLALAAIVLVLGGALAWWWTQQRDPGSGTPVIAQVEAQAPAAGSTAAEMPVEEPQAQMPGPRGSTEVLQSSVEELRPPMEQPQPTVEGPQPPAVAPQTLVESNTPAPALWMLPPMDAQMLLWEYATTAPFPDELCAQDSPAGLACIEAQAATWDELEAIDRPLLLDLVTPERFAAAAVMLGIEGRSAWLATEAGLVQRELAEIGPLWNGKYRYLWHKPVGFERPLAQGDRSAVVADIAQLFAQLDGQQQALAGEKFTAALKQRVMLFQRTHDLEDDGVVGAQTLMRLNQALAIDPSATALRRELQQQGALTEVATEHDG